MSNASIRLLKAYTEAHGTSGAEDQVRALFVKELRGYGEISSDALGSVACTRGGPNGSPHVMITAHMDEVGFAVHSITKNGFLKIVALGGWWTHNLLSQRVRIRTSGGEVLGVITSTPPHFLPESQRSNVLPIEKLYIDVGATSREEAMGKFGIQLGDPIVPASDFTTLANPDFLLCKAFDNRVGCALITQAMQELKPQKLSCTLSAVGTVQEEVGCRGATTAANLVRPDLAFILEGTPADDTPGAAEDEPQGSLGQGPQIRLLDPSALMHRGLAEWVIQVARKLKLPHQVAVRRSGGTDAKSIQLSGTGVPCVVIAVPARYIHSHNSVIFLPDYLNTLRLLTALITQCDARLLAKLSAR